MTLEQFDTAVISLAASVPAMTLATSADGRPRAADVYFAAAGYDFVFFSSPSSRHCRNLLANPSCAATIHAPAVSWREIKGPQTEGTAEPVTEVEAMAHASLGALFGLDNLEQPSRRCVEATQLFPAKRRLRSSR